jgi:hypothetical protein
MQTNLLNFSKEDMWMVDRHILELLLRAYSKHMTAFGSARIPKKPTYSMKYEYYVPMDVRLSLMGLRSILLKRLFESPDQTIILKDARRLVTTALSRSISFHLCLFLNQLRNQLIRQIKNLYENETLDNESLMEPFKKILQIFFDRKDIAMIDTFAILNSFRKEGCRFWHDSKCWTVCFSAERASLRLGKSTVTITVDPSIFFDMFRLITRQLPPPQKDLISMMYLTVLKEINAVPPIRGFHLTIEKNYRYWCVYLRWKNERDYLISNVCSAFFNLGLFSKKDTKYYRANSNQDSIEDFLKQGFIANHDEFKGKGILNSLSFEEV